MTGAVMPILSYGAAPAGDCDLEFIAGESEAAGVSTRPGDEFGEVLSTSAFFDSLGTTYALVTLFPGFMQLIFDNDVPQSAFESMTITQWGETFLSADADYFNTPGVDTFFTWNSNTQEFEEDEEYCATFTQYDPSAFIAWQTNSGEAVDLVSAAYAVNFDPIEDATVSVLSNFTASVNLTGTSPRSFAYPAGLTVNPADNPVIVLTLAGGPVTSNPTAITFGGMAMSRQNQILDSEDTNQHLCVAMLPLRGGLPATNTISVTWAAANGFTLRVRVFILGFVAPSSDNFGGGYVANTATINADGEVTMAIGHNAGSRVVTGLFSPIPTTMTAPTGYTESGNATVGGDNFYNVAHRLF